MAVGWLLLSISGFLFPDLWFCYRAISVFSVPEILRTAESLKVWVLKQFEIVIVQCDGLQVLLSMVVLFHSNQSYYRGGG